MGTNSIKELLLNKPVTELGLGNSFNNYFLRFPNDDRSRCPLEPAITLKEFFARNKEFLSEPSGHFSCDALGDGFSLQSSTFQRLKSFLIMKGFTQDDWIMLGSKPSQGNLFPFSFDKKSEILNLRFITLGLVRSRSTSFESFLRLLPGKKIESITIADILAITLEDVEEVTGTKGLWNMSYAQVQSFRTFITTLQVNLGKMGLTFEDGSFMTLSFKKHNVSKRSLKKAA